AADVIDVVMGGDEVVDLLQTHRMGGVGDDLGIGVFAAVGIAAVDQHRTAMRRDEQGAAAAFDVDRDHLQSVVGGLHRSRQGDGDTGQQGKSKFAFHRFSPKEAVSAAGLFLN